jgi:flagellar biosynthesis protein FlhB
MSSEARPFPPSARKLRRARREGDVARGRLWGAAVAGLVGGGLVTVLGTPAAAEVLALARRVLAAPSPSVGLDALAEATVPLVLGPSWLLAGAVALVATLDVGGLFAPAALAPRLARLGRPLDREALLEGVLGLLAALLPLAVAARLVLATWGSGPLPPRLLVGALRTLSGRFLLEVGAVLLIAAGLERLWQRARRRHRLSMSASERQREAREAEGEPRMKRRRLARQRAAALEPTVDEGLLDPRARVVVEGRAEAALVGWDQGGAPVLLARARGRDRARLRAAALPVVRDAAFPLRRLSVGTTLPPWAARRLARRLRR